MKIPALAAQLRCLSVLAVVTLGLPAGAAEPEVDFIRQVQPIFAKHCYQCHGPNKAEGGLRLHAEGPAGAKLESGEFAIVPGQPEKSELLVRVASDDESLRMPPEGKPLSAEEQSLLKQWIAAGARFQQHFAFQPLARPQPPAVKDSGWIRSPLDRFILARLEERDVKPASPADKRTLLRRVTYTLTGLPPTMGELNAFLADESPQAFEKVIDRLLASPQYGEHWGRKWLDVVRYAETNSFERDNPKPNAWRFRDYVIRSFNADKPYDQFVREQLAGDELPGAVGDAIIATGFYRLGLWDDEPSDRLQARFDELDDMVTTTGQAFLGLTVNCARCHDHKIDPFPQQDYYQLVAFFHNIKPYTNGGPNVDRQVFADEAAARAWHGAKRQLAEEQNKTRAELARLDAQYLERLAAQSGRPAGVRDLEDLQYRYYRDTWQSLPDFSALKDELRGKLELGLVDLSPADREEAYGFVFEGQLIAPRSGEYTFWLDSDDGARLSLDGKPVLEHDGLHKLGQERSAKIELAEGRHPFRLEYFQFQNERGLKLAWAGPGLDRRTLARDPAAKPPAVKDVPAAIRADAGRTFGKANFNRYQELRKQLGQLAARERAMPVEIALAVTENGRKAPDTFVLGRGNPTSPGEKVEPGFPSVLGGNVAEIPEPREGLNSSGRRTVLANWIASKDNRLTARVIVNRVWQHHFGRGIVASPNNFGLGGAPPTHPDLLDWLACELVDGGWRLKALHKKILLSAAYEMSPTPAENALEKDPDNALFSRFAIRRLAAEEVRDSLLATAGQLNPKMFGPSMYPDISAEVLAGQSRPGYGWGKSSPEEQNRRSIYIHVKRSLIEPLLADFDFPDTDFTCEARFSTTQPSQSLALLNGKFASDQAARFAERLRKEAGAASPDRVRLAYTIAFQREPSPAELDRGLALLDALEQQFGQSPDDSLKWFCLTMLNRNEYLYVD